jgi:hypothetical protein
MIETTKDSNGVPTWAAVLIVLIALGAGGWILWRYWISPPSVGQVVTITPTAGPGGGPAAGPGAGPAAGFAPMQAANVGPENPNIRSRGNRWTVVGGPLMFLVFRDENGDSNYDFRYMISAIPRGQNFIWDHRGYLRTGAARDGLHLSEQQFQSLQPLCFVSLNAPVPDDQQKAIEAAWTALLAAPDSGKVAAQTALISAVEQAGNAVAGQASDAAEKRAERITAILTPDQLDAFHKIYERPKTSAPQTPANPTTLPTTRPALWTPGEAPKRTNITPHGFASTPIFSAPSAQRA